MQVGTSHMSATAARHLCSRSIAYRRLNPRLDDFSHHAPGIARLNNGSFGAAPQPVLKAEMAHRSWWRANPDAAYFGIGASSLDARLAAAADAAAVAIGAPAGSVALVENATVATAIIASRWAKALREGRHERRSVLLLDVCYKAAAYSVRDICGAAGGAHAQSIEDKLRSQLRSTVQELRQLQDNQAQLQGDKAAAEKQRDDALAQLKAMQGQLAAARGDSGAEAAAKARGEAAGDPASGSLATPCTRETYAARALVQDT